MQMIKTTENALADFIYASGDELKTDSLKVAKAFNKKHKNVVRSIKNLKCSEKFNELNFEPVKYKDQKGEWRTKYEMTKNGFVMLVMGFTTKSAFAIKEAYISAFDNMQAMINEENNTLIRQFFHLVEKENQSFAVASMAGRVLQRRKEDKESNMSEMETLKKSIQPDLFDTNKNGVLIGLAASQNSTNQKTLTKGN